MDASKDVLVNDESCMALTSTKIFSLTYMALTAARAANYAYSEIKKRNL